jgi:hypothetical protein
MESGGSEFVFNVHCSESSSSVDDLTKRVDVSIDEVSRCTDSCTEFLCESDGFSRLVPIDKFHSVDADKETEIFSQNLEAILSAADASIQSEETDKISLEVDSENTTSVQHILIVDGKHTLNAIFNFNQLY